MTNTCGNCKFFNEHNKHDNFCGAFGFDCDESWSVWAYDCQYSVFVFFV